MSETITETSKYKNTRLIKSITTSISYLSLLIIAPLVVDYIGDLMVVRDYQLRHTIYTDLGRQDLASRIEENLMI